MKGKLLAKAILLAAKVFENKTDRQGVPYIFHCLEVMYGIHSEDEDENVAAVLHDVPEDIPEYEDFTLLQKEGFSQRSIEILKLLKHSPEDDYLSVYIPKLARDKSAKKIKRSDLRHNTSIDRSKGLRMKDFDRLQKYYTAYAYLND